MSQVLPGGVTSTVSDNVIHINRTGLEYGPDVILDSTNADSGNTPTTRMRKGNVVVLRTSTGRYIEADDSNGDRNTQAIVTASETADADWASKDITLTINGVAVVTVSLGGADDTDAEVVTALNGNAIFAANAIASAANSRVVIKSLRAGADVYMKITSTLSTAFGASGTAAYGADADYRVTEEDADLVDGQGTAVNAPAKNSTKAFYDESALVISGAAATSSLLWGEARAVLSRRGARFG